jgi:hypothetical protein
VDVAEEENDVEVGEVGRVGIEFVQGGGEQAGRAEGVVAAEVMHGYGDLNEGLEEEFFGLRRDEPDGLPVLVRGEELGCVVAAQAFGQGAVGPIECHGDECIGLKVLRVENRWFVLQLSMTLQRPLLLD